MGPKMQKTLLLLQFLPIPSYLSNNLVWSLTKLVVQKFKFRLYWFKKKKPFFTIVGYGYWSFKCLLHFISYSSCPFNSNLFQNMKKCDSEFWILPLFTLKFIKKKLKKLSIALPCPTTLKRLIVKRNGWTFGPCGSISSTIWHVFVNSSQSPCPLPL